MQPERLGALKQTRLSFVRQLIDKMVDEQWDIRPETMSLDRQGSGRVVYHIETPSRLFSFGIFSRTSGEGEDTDRIIATDWDLYAFLCEGEVTPELMESQEEELPHVMEGRATPEVLIWTRANRSSRFFGHIVESLAEGHQPDIDFLAQGCYLMRSSGYYGNGLNGTKVFRAYDSEHPLRRPYFPQFLAAYMLRIFGYDLAEQMANARNSDAATLDHDIKRYLGTGNSSGVGIIFYLINHPKQLHTWLRAREVALARAKTIEPTDDDVERFEQLLEKAIRWFSEDDSDTNRFFVTKDRIAEELALLSEQVETPPGDSDETLWARLCEWAEDDLEMETQEVLHSLLIDVYPEVCEGLETSLTTNEKSDIVPDMSVSTLRSFITSGYQWALDIDMDRPDARHYFWYRSIENEEPRIGVRGETGYEEYAFPLDVAYQVQQLESDLEEYAGSDTVAEFLFDHPDHWSIVERVQNLHGLSYAEIHCNPMDAEFVPLYFISCIKAIWGIQKTHPKSLGWVKGTFFQGAPLPDGIRNGDDSYWMYPPKPERTAYWREEQ